MRIRLLGTGSADGWPNPWCDCASCAWAREHNEIRGQTAILVDDVLLVDCGPDVPRAAAHQGVRLSGLRHLLVGHAHPDHLGPECLMWRSWSTASGRPLDVVAPPAALEVCRAFLTRWEGADPERAGAPLHFVEAVAGRTLRLGDAGTRYEIRPLAALHGDASIGPAVLFDITAPDGGRVLYGCDTAAPLPAATLAAVEGRAYDVVALEENNGDRPGFGEHLGLDSFGELVGELRRRDAIVETTEILAVHLSHRNPPGDELARRLAHHGARAPRDGETLDLTPRARSDCQSSADGDPDAASQTNADGRVGRSVVGAHERSSGREAKPIRLCDGTPAVAAPPRRTLVLGGSRSGKSAEAERRLLAEPEVVYIATAAPPDPADSEWFARISAHQARRPPAWTTVETLDLVPLLRTPGPPLLIDGIGLWVAAHLDVLDPSPPDLDAAHPGSPDAAGASARNSRATDIAAAGRGLDDRMAELVDAWRITPRRVVAVSDEVGSGVVPATAAGRRFRDALGRANAALAAACDEVCLVVAGIVVPLYPRRPGQD
ncbi:adenosylcobinamide kinase / adenosylcobinamide-phosphate guanylyltransferase [Frankia sp. AiPs1]|uniref:bifunctional adenosylcobinamide kinase/adenosylcobinamide-phosphate guanylyltransferase n=1 Tax=Frankia sp. AiPa1 TaxID=573492 RepID=UPI00202B8509|nr:bifunctional adenosylcobinamide kinase/adenosylcobinamide-phosphate guanylyltransferase [Frankia sp. AiPa1]MCL9762389.1 bifunctional adenosylcobinamide kinase/adenosylcobinamide-phosphate guanylyltransferase [Frankia sp. AiPa1]